jgi:hypothetical protein
MFRPSVVVATLCAAASLQAGAAPPSRSGLPPDVVDRSEGLRCQGELVADDKTLPIRLEFDTPDRYGAQGNYTADRHASAFYGCKPSTPSSLLCKADAGRVTLPMKMKFSGDMRRLTGSFESPFENGSSMTFTATCVPP